MASAHVQGYAKRTTAESLTLLMGPSAIADGSFLCPGVI